MGNWRKRARSINKSGLRHFGEAVFHYPADSKFPLKRKGVFNDIYSGVDANTGFPVVSQTPNLGFIPSDWVPQPAEGDTFLIRGQRYKFLRPEKDGEGGSLIFLTRFIPRTGDFNDDFNNDFDTANQPATATAETGFAATRRILKASQRVFGSPLIYKIKGGAQYNDLRGIFKDKYEGPDPDNAGFMVVMEAPNLGIRLAEWPGRPKEGDSLVFDGRLYRVRVTHVDGEGGATVLLQKIRLPNGIGGDFNNDFGPDFQIPDEGDFNADFSDDFDSAEITTSDIDEDD